MAKLPVKIIDGKAYRMCPGCREFKPLKKQRKYCTPECSKTSRLAKEVTYEAYHYRVYAARGKANKCITGCTSKIYHWANVSGNYKNIWDYVPMCPSCHRKLDHEKRQRGIFGDPLLLSNRSGRKEDRLCRL